MSIETDDGLEPWERCGCAACHATMDALYGDDEEPLGLSGTTMTPVTLAWALWDPDA